MNEIPENFVIFIRVNDEALAFESTFREFIQNNEKTAEIPQDSVAPDDIFYMVFLKIALIIKDFENLLRERRRNFFP